MQTSKTRPTRWIAGLCLGLAFGLASAEPAPAPLDDAQRDRVIDAAIAQLDARYVFPNKAREVAALLRERQSAGAYDGLTNAEQFAATLTQDIQQPTGDRHLDIRYSAQTLPPAPAQGPMPTAPEELAAMRRLNYGLAAVDRLRFNIGYVSLEGFAPASMAAGRLAAAMTLMADTDSLIIDLRDNRGGEPETVSLLASYLFERPTRLNDTYLREGDRTQQHWTIATVDGPRYGEQRKLYLLIGPGTFSAGESFAYALKHLHRATLVGATTGGGAHPGDVYRIDDHFEMFVPNGRSVSPVTGTNWEGVGVAPDVAVDPDKALDVAQALILRDRLPTARDEHEKARMQKRLSELE